VVTKAIGDYIKKMKTIEAVYEHGVLRPLEPLSLPEGAHVRVSVAGKAGSDEVPKEVSRPQKTPAQILAEIAALSEHHGVMETASVNHDEILYGWKRAR
jgi:predicted DNA-binding antitoxin AbrB/MazE fold protein